MEPSTKAFHDLEWPTLVTHLAERCQSRQGRDRALDLSPAETLDDARHRWSRSRDAVEAARAGELIPLGPLPDVSEALHRLERDADATSHELHGVREMLRNAHGLRRWANARRDRHPALAAALHSPPELDRLLGTLDHALDTDGTLSDRASHDLALARRRAQEARQRILSRLDELIGRYAEVLQDRYYTVRDGRYVLPVRSDAHIRVVGIVHGSSSSGATLFIEPRSVVQLGNQLKVAQADVEREEARVLAELSARCRGELHDIDVAHRACVEADLLLAISRLAADLSAECVEPEAEPVLSLRLARHPLLVLADGGVVANDLSLAAGRCLVISGPNAGGKTVALKTLGLVALMVRAGLPVPVLPGSRVGWFDPVFCDVGDDQSLARSLSTFSAHVTHLAEVLRGVRQGALVLLDELAGGTDPEEGAALAAAVLESLATRGAAVAVTTHYELLKTLAVRDARFENASVGFDLATMSPTFTVTMGVPGASSALAVARRFGVPEAVVERARALLPEHAGSREDVLRRLEDEERAMRLARAAAEEESRTIAKLRLELESERNAQRAREQARVSREGSEVLAALRRAREELREAELRVQRKKLTEQELREAERKVNAVAKELSIDGALGRALDPKRDKPARRAPREDELKPGAKVYAPRLGGTVEVLEIGPRGQLRVAAGALKLFVAADEVLIDESPPRARPRR
ncbi:MAG: endonuclease MutS2 [Polyangiales bacterium]